MALKVLSDLQTILKEIDGIQENSKYLLENTYFLPSGKVLCLPRKNGVSRFPYGEDGFTLWAYSSGNISINESTFYSVLPSDEGKEPYLAFFAGEKNGDKFTPISILGNARNPLEGDNIKRFVVYSKDSVYYISKTTDCIYSARVVVSKDKKVFFTLSALNNSKNKKDIYLSSYINCLFKYGCGESMETKWFKKCTYQNDRFVFESPEDIDRTTHIDNYGYINREFVKGSPIKSYNTTSKNIYTGARDNQLINSTALRSGTFEKEKHVTHFTDTAVMGDINHYQIEAGESIHINYVLASAHDLANFETLLKEIPSFIEVEELLSKKEQLTSLKENDDKRLKFTFKNWNNTKIDAETLNLFLNYVIYQTEYCGLAKNSGAMFLGTRDVMQQVEAACIWNPEDCRKKILETVSFIDSSGNPPRQYSIPPKGSTPAMDLRDFIDQGVWIINTVYTYLCFSNDYSILKDEIGYYDRLSTGGVTLSSRSDSLLDHLLQIMDYLLAHIDSKTGCLRAMYGDWNDALDGLGVSSDPNEKYGDGVSVMATLQLYLNLQQMREILTKINYNEEVVIQYQQVQQQIKEGIAKYAIVSNGKEHKIVHGWGEHLSYYVGSYRDVDQVSRDSCTANAFYVLSGMNQENFLTHEDIVSSFERLDSKYGLKTFEPYFEVNVKGVGRIVNLPKGTAENAATYIHGALFGVWALFKIGECQFAYDQLEKLLPLSHDILTTTPFVMPNSYSYNVEEDMDGESMSDWYTGSANTLIKSLLFGAFGVENHLDYLLIKPHKCVPCKMMNVHFAYQGCLVDITYKMGEVDLVTVNNKVINDSIICLDKDILTKEKKIEVVISIKNNF